MDVNQRIEKLKEKIKPEAQKEVVSEDQEMYLAARKANDELFSGLKKMLKANEKDMIQVKKDIAYLIKITEEFIVNKK